MASTLPFGASIDSIFNRMLFQEGAAANTGDRVPILWESPLSRREGRSLRMVINPQAIEFTQPKRISARDTIGGKVYHHWTDSRGRNNDILTLTVRGTTGNIDPRVLKDASPPSGTSLAQAAAGSTGTGSSSKKSALGNLAKHLAWAKLYQLTVDPIIDPLNNTVNLVTCTIQTVLLPFPIQFAGHFPAAMSFTDAADNPWNKGWSLGLVVQSINPELSTIVSLLQVALVTGVDLSQLQRPLSYLP